MSKHLRSLLETLAETLWAAQLGEEQAPPSEITTMAIPAVSLEVDDGRSRVAIRWDAGGKSGRVAFTKSQLQGALRSLQANGAGKAEVRGLGAVSWRKSAEEVREVALDNDVICMGPGESGPATLTAAAVRSLWTDGGFPLLSGAEEATIHLSRKGQKLTGDLWAWRQAKAVGVPLARARSNEDLPSAYLSPSDRRSPGRLRRRSLYREAVDGTPYFAKKNLIARGEPPELADKHRETDGRIGPNLKNMTIQRGTLFGQARPTTYVESEDNACKTQRLVALENGMLVPVRECLFLLEQFPEATWTTAHLHRTVEKGLGGEKKISRTYPVVISNGGTIVGSVAPLKKRLDDLRSNARPISR